MASQETGTYLQLWILEPQLQPDGTVEIVRILIGTVIDGCLHFPDEP